MGFEFNQASTLSNGYMRFAKIYKGKNLNRKNYNVLIRTSELLEKIANGYGENRFMPDYFQKDMDVAARMLDMLFEKIGRDKFGVENIIKVVNGLNKRMNNELNMSVKNQPKKIVEFRSSVEPSKIQRGR